jgi:hypothetical protein
MKLTSHLPDDRRAHVEGRLRANLMAWLTTVRPDGRPDSVPVSCRFGWVAAHRAAQSRPRSSAVLTAWARLRAPVLAIAADR